MYKKTKPEVSSLKINKSYIGERIEEKIERIVNNNEPIKDGAPLIYTDRKNGVQPEYDIRTDRWEIAVEAMDKVSKSHIAKRENRTKTGDKKMGEEAKNNMGKESGETPVNTSDK